ncbi:hypothetical protein [Planococcus wigleyi]|uniref:DUF3892 domain-containing protein n=1 Tax=Planococcus wigleyi TaxID=2762216 RepID=A0ABR8WA35_9BACL|nr:hypothetical protein [Planococcus wigleyi]MBD8013869.1 hypothetical protein [Planococcus wigleyi]
MIMKYKLLYKSGVKEEFTQEGSRESLAGVHNIFYEAFAKDLNAVVTFGDGEDSGRYIRVSDVSQFEMEILPDGGTEIINSN